MSNKKLFKEMYSDKINKDKNYQEILKCIEKAQNKKHILKKSIIPITSTLVISLIILLNLNNAEKTSNSNNPLINTYEDSDITTSQKNENIDNFNFQDIDIKINDVDYQKIINNDSYTFLKNINIPNDLNTQTYQAIYIKENNAKEDYTTLYNYSFKYENKNDNRKIILSFSDKYQPLRDYIYTDNKQTKKINNTEITIYKNNNTSNIIFNYHNLNFDIETTNILEEELTNLLTSIIK